MIVSKGCTYQVVNPKVVYQELDPAIARLAEAIRSAAAAQVPRDHGDYSSSWVTERVRPATYWVRSTSPHARFVEYGTRSMPARPVFGRIIAQVRSSAGRR